MEFKIVFTFLFVIGLSKLKLTGSASQYSLHLVPISYSSNANDHSNSSLLPAQHMTDVLKGVVESTILTLPNK